MERSHSNIALGNDPRAFEPVRGVVLKPFCVAGSRMEVDVIVELPRHDALSLVAQKKLRLL